MPPNVLATMVTTTSYGTWLPGELRGYVDKGVILPPTARRSGRGSHQQTLELAS